MNPSAKMDVNGNMKIDSTLIVKDSIIVEKDLRTKGKFVVEDEASFLQNVFMYADLSVAGKISANKIDVTGNATIGNKLSVDGNADFGGAVKMTDLAVLNNLSNSNLKLLIQMPSGELKTGGIDELKTAIYEELYEPKTCPPGDILNPTWANGLNKIYEDCPQVKVGINTNDPQPCVFYLKHLQINIPLRLFGGKVNLEVLI